MIKIIVQAQFQQTPQSFEMMKHFRPIISKSNKVEIQAKKRHKSRLGGLPDKKKTLTPELLGALNRSNVSSRKSSEILLSAVCSTSQSISDYR